MVKKLDWKLIAICYQAFPSFSSTQRHDLCTEAELRQCVLEHCILASKAPLHCSVKHIKQLSVSLKGK